MTTTCSLLPGKRRIQGAGARVDCVGVGFGRRSFSEYYPIRLEPRTLIRCFEAEGIDRR